FSAINFCRVNERCPQLDTTTQGLDATTIFPGTEADLRYHDARIAKWLQFHTSLPPTACCRGRSRELVRINGNFDHRWLPTLQGRLYRIADLIGVLDIIALSAKQVGELVIARVTDIGTDIALVVKVFLVGFLRAPAVIVHHQCDDVDAVPH